MMKDERSRALDADAIIDAACQEAGFSDWDDAQIREPLGVLVKALESEADLNEAGVAGAGRRLRNLVGSYARMQHDAIQYPEVLELPIEAPIVLVGLPRSGTTLLHALLAADPAHRAPQWWESIYPSPPPEAATYDTDPRRAKVQAELDAMHEASPKLSSALPYAAGLTAECNTLVQPSLRTVAFGAAFHVPSFDAWYLGTSQRPMYRYHRRCLQQLSWRGPQGRWTLKAPPHMLTMHELVAEYPEATIVQIHRDPMKTAASNASLYHLNRIIHSDHAHPEVAGRDTLALWAEGARRLRQFQADRPDVRIIELTYDELVADHIGTVRRLYSAIGEELTPAAEAAMREWLVENDRQKRPEHRYALEDFGLSPQDIFDNFGEFEPRSSL